MDLERDQVGVLAFREVAGRIEILLTTSRETGRWVVPKGWPMKGKAPHQAAGREAFEEAGVKGAVETDAIGSYVYDKKLRSGHVVPCRVSLFPMRVDDERRKWPESEQRLRRWFAPEQAANAVAEPGLADLILRFDPDLPTLRGAAGMWRR